MNTYNWLISSLQCYPQEAGKQNVVFMIHWRRQAVNETGLTGDVNGAEPITLDPNAEFTPFENLTEAEVIGWLVAALGPDRIAETQEALDKQISDQVTPPVITPPLPW